MSVKDADNHFMEDIEDAKVDTARKVETTKHWFEGSKADGPTVVIKEEPQPTPHEQMKAQVIQRHMERESKVDSGACGDDPRTVSGLPLPPPPPWSQGCRRRRPAQQQGWSAGVPGPRGQAMERRTQAGTEDSGF